VFSVVNQAEEAVHRDLEEWSRVAAKLVNQAIETGSPLRRRIEANARLISLIQSDAVSTPENFRGVRDTNGSLQAGAIVTDMDDYLYVDYMATAPWNITRDSPRAVRRAATMLMAQIVRESIDQGYGGQIIVDAVGTADFYRTMGFIETGFGSASAPEMVLTSEAARDFLDDVTGE
jgi:hypothetical protein